MMLCCAIVSQELNERIDRQAYGQFEKEALSWKKDAAGEEGEGGADRLEKKNYVRKLCSRKARRNVRCVEHGIAFG